MYSNRAPTHAETKAESLRTTHVSQSIAGQMDQRNTIKPKGKKRRRGSRRREEKRGAIIVKTTKQNNNTFKWRLLSVEEWMKVAKRRALDHKAAKQLVCTNTTSKPTQTKQQERERAWRSASSQSRTSVSRESVLTRCISSRSEKRSQ